MRLGMKMDGTLTFIWEISRVAPVLIEQTNTNILIFQPLWLDYQMVVEIGESSAEANRKLSDLLTQGYAVFDLCGRIRKFEKEDWE